MYLSATDDSPTTVVDAIVSPLDSQYCYIKRRTVTASSGDGEVVFAHNQGFNQHEGQRISWRELFGACMMRGRGSPYAPRNLTCSLRIAAASLGSVGLPPAKTLAAAFDLADQDMLAMKRANRSAAAE